MSPSLSRSSSSSSFVDGWDLSANNWYQNARITTTATVLRNLADAVSIPYHYKQYANDRHSVHLKLEGNYPDGTPIDDLRILIYLPKVWAVEGHSPVSNGGGEVVEVHGEKIAKTKKGVLIHCAGGGFTMCRPENEGHLCRTICDNLGCILISPDYVKAPQHPYPQALYQMYALLQWVARPPTNPDSLIRLLDDKLGTPSRSTYLPLVDHTKIALSGGSSGGNLVAALTVLAIQNALQLGGELEVERSRIVGLVLDYAMLDISMVYREKLAHVTNASKVLPRWLTRMFLDGYLGGALRSPSSHSELIRNHTLSPGLCSTEVLKQFPEKVIMIMAENDYLCYEGEVFARRLVEEAGYVEGESLLSKTFEGVGHAFDLVPPTISSDDECAKGKARNEAWDMIVKGLTQVL